MQSPLSALDTLKKGNERFVTNKPNTDIIANQATGDSVPAQKPFAIILGCADSRVPAELIFNQGFGDLFVIRVAGNVVSPIQMGSVEFAVENFKTPLVVVLGHSNCGAVAATIKTLQQPNQQAGGSLSPSLTSIVDLISPAVTTLLDTPPKENYAELLAQAIRANIHLAAEHLRHGSAILKERSNKNELLIVGAEYSLETGVVEFFDGVPV